MVKPIVWLRRLYLVGLIAFALWSARHGDFFIFGSLVFGLALGWILRPFIFKRALLNSLHHWTTRPSSLGEFPRLDRARVELFSQQWQDLGFELCGAFAVGFKNPAFSLLLRHPTEGAIAEISQVFALKTALPVKCAVLSFWGDARDLERLSSDLEREQNTSPLSSPEGASRQPERVVGEDELLVWSYATHNRAPNGYWKVLRYSRVLGTRLAPDTSPAELWRVHLERRAFLDERIPAPRIEDDLVRVLQSHAVVLTQLWRTRCRRTPFWRFLARAQRAPPEFLGEFSS